MSILIKGIDLPKEGRLKIEITSDGLVWIDKGREFYAHKDYAIQIPTPHGRLIDADFFKEIIKNSVPAWRAGVKIPTYGDMDIMDKIYFIPTILEAEE